MVAAGETGKIDYIFGGLTCVIGQFILVSLDGKRIFSTQECPCEQWIGSRGTARTLLLDRVGSPVPPREQQLRLHRTPPWNNLTSNIHH